MKPFWWLALIATVLACGGTATLAPSPVAQPSPASTLAAPRGTVEQNPSPTLTSATAVNPDRTLAATSQTAQGPVVSIGGAAFPVELALTSEEKKQGLSGRPILIAGTGMFFVYQQQSRYSFWMPDMLFPLDIVWIGSDCSVADVTLNALPPEPGQSIQDLPFYSPKSPAQYVLEINAGEAGAKGIKEGVGVEFLGELDGKYGC